MLCVLRGSIALSGIFGSVGESWASFSRKRVFLRPHKDATAIAARTMLDCQCLRAAPRKPPKSLDILPPIFPAKPFSLLRPSAL